ncbi:MAG: hypothetical protein IPQ09_20585, partial [Myxococcales bacterium]|nr:hypothetical protein [Myxococcales bacterium]
MFEALHSKGYVVGDVNESNVWVGENTLVTLIDTDSFQVRGDNAGEVYRCFVGKDEFTPPELSDVPFKDVERTREHDHFGLGVLIHYLLLGTHPFQGTYRGPGEAPRMKEKIAKGLLPYSIRRSVPLDREYPSVPIDVVHPDLQRLFMRCFDDGHAEPLLRPTARDWRRGIAAALKELGPCKARAHHFYGSHLPECPWCEHVPDLFPDPPTGRVATARVVDAGGATKGTTGTTPSGGATRGTATQAVSGRVRVVGAGSPGIRPWQPVQPP